MAEKRMFTQKIIDSDAFLEMPLSAQALYFHLNMRADDDGFVNNPRRVTKLVSASDDDLKILLLKRFIIGFESGVIVIKHWRMHNTLKSDRYHPTDYQDEFKRLGIKPNKSYTDHPESLIPPAPDGTNMEPKWNQDGSTLEPENREDIEENRKDKVNTPISSVDEKLSGISIILNDGTEFMVSEEYIEKMKPLFPAVNIRSEMRKMSAWCLNNPSRRKTKRGVTRFINSWLSTAQQEAEEKKAKGQSDTNNIFLKIAEERHDSR